MDPRTTRAGLSRQATLMSIYQIKPDVVGEWGDEDERCQGERCQQFRSHKC